MISQIYSLYNKVTQNYGDLLEMSNDKIACRWYHSFIDVQLKKHQEDHMFDPDDFELYHIAELNRDDNLLKICPMSPVLVCSQTFTSPVVDEVSNG